ncbi:major facilitator superfamily domain-containing protein [Xylariaceae sp. FL0662B]|nr:major facilitator superfamily domain-containing protein [Xylariaceae sp. FL0662B]
MEMEWDTDSRNPRNFSLHRRVFSTVSISFLAFASTIGASIYSPGQDAVASEFRVSNEVERFGRKVVFLTATPLFALFILGGAVSSNITTLIVCRFLAGAFAAPNVSNASATITDYTASAFRAVTLSFYYTVPFCGAMTGPLLGGFIVQAKSWRWTQWTTIFFMITFYVPVFFTKETYKKVILGQQDHMTVVQGLKHFMTAQIIRPLHMLFTEPVVACVSIYNGFLFGLMYALVVASPSVFQYYYGFDQTSQTLSFIGLIVGAITAPLPLALMDAYLYQPKFKRFRETSTDEFPAENRLGPAMVGSLGLPIALFIFGWSAYIRGPWIVPIIFEGIALHFSIYVYVSTSLFMLDVYGPLYGASATGAAMLSRYVMSTAFPLFSLQMYKSLGVGWATSVLAFSALAMAPIPWVFVKFGNRWRGMSRYERSS